MKYLKATLTVLGLATMMVALRFLTADAYRTIYNPFTGRLDYVGVSSGDLPSGSTFYIQVNTTSLVQNATFYVSSGTANIFFAPQLQGTTYYFLNTPSGNLTLALFRLATLNDFGGEAGTLGLTGADDTGFGNSACGVLTTGNSDSCFGTLSLNNGASGTSDSCFGFNSCSLIVNGSSNTALGSNALAGGANSQNDTAGGYNSLASANENAGSGDNTAYGANSGLSVGTGVRNTFIGSGADIGTGSFSSVTVLGYGSKALDAQSVVIGPNSQSSGTLSAVIGSTFGVTNEFRLIVSSATHKQATISSMTLSGLLSAPMLMTDSGGVVVSTYARVVQVYVSSGSDVTASSVVNNYINCLDYSSTVTVPTGDLLFMYFGALTDTGSSGTNGEIGFNVWQDNVSTITTGNSGLGVTFNVNRLVDQKSMFMWFKPSDANSHVYTLRFSNIGGTTSVNCGSGNNYMITEVVKQ